MTELETITSRQNPLVKSLRELQQAKGRRAAGAFLLEGTHLIQEAIATRYPLRIVGATPEWQARHSDLWQTVCAQAERALTLGPVALGAIATTEQPDGIVAAARRRGTVPLDHWGRLNLVLESIRDPGNLGTIIRSAAAAGCDRLWVSADSADLDQPKVLRASAGQWFRLPMAVVEDLPRWLAEARAAGVRTIATTPTAPLSYWDADWQGGQPVALVLGNEAAGLSAAVLAQTQEQVRVPLAAGVESLNVGVTAALLLYELRRQERSAAASARETLP